MVIVFLNEGYTCQLILQGFLPNTASPPEPLPPSLLPALFPLLRKHSVSTHFVEFYILYPLKSSDAKLLKDPILLVDTQLVLKF